MANSKHIALDFDGDLGAAYSVLKARGVTLPSDAPVQRTGKGHHVLLSTAEPVGDAVAWLKGEGWQIDVRGIGYIIVEPSIHQNGTPYEWIRPFATPAPPAPAALINMLQRRDEREGLFADPVRESWIVDMILHGAPEGQRNNDGARLAGYLLRVLPRDIAEAVMLCFASNCTPPMSRYEVEMVCNSIAQRVARER